MQNDANQNDVVACCSLESWELELARKIAWRFKSSCDPEDIIPELQEHILLIKKRFKKRTKDWKAYLASSLLNRAKRLLRSRKRSILETPLEEAGACEPLGSATDPAVTVESGGALERLLKLYEELDPQQQQLWDLLVEHQGNTAEVARRLKKNRQAVDYHVQKLRRLISGCVGDS